MMDQRKSMSSPADKLRALLAGPEMMVISACYDALTARLIEQAGMPATFMSGFGVAATDLISNTVHIYANSDHRVFPGTSSQNIFN